MPVRTLGVDWAVYQSSGDHRLLKQQGATFLIAKVTQDTFADSYGDDHIRKAKAAGLIPGAYHFLLEPGAGKGPTKVQPDGDVVNGYRDGRGAASAEEQARNFVAKVRAFNGGTLDGIICAVDLEALDKTSFDGRTRRINSRPKAYHARAFIKEFHRLAPGRPILVYTTASYLSGVDMRQWTQPTRLWLARWTMSSVNLINSGRTGISEGAWVTRTGGLHPDIIQYQSGNHGGRAGGVYSDLCASDLTRQQLLEQLTRPKGAAAPDPDPIPTPGPDPGPEPTPDPAPSVASTHRCRPSLTASLRAAPTRLVPELASVPGGTAIRAVRGRIGSWYQVGGVRSCLWLEVSGLDGHRISPPLWAPELAFSPRPTRATTSSDRPSPPPSGSE